MRTVSLEYANVNAAFYGLVNLINEKDVDVVQTASRVGDVIQIVSPVSVTYQNPLQRVLFNPARDANPFFHLFESLWMLAGRNDVAPLAFYTSKIAEIASDDGKTFNGAYGYRWRHAAVVDTPYDSHDPAMSIGDYLDDPKGCGHAHVTVDQLSRLISHLKANPKSRRAVLSMWNVEDDLLKIDVTKDVCCNTQVYFSIRVLEREPDETYQLMSDVATGNVRTAEGTGRIVRAALDMTVTNRSNDLVLGMLGANVVHFSYLQQYVADCLGVEVGYYTQFTNNLHVYTSNWKPEEWLKGYDHAACYPHAGKVTKLVQDKATFDREVGLFVENYHNPRPVPMTFREPYLELVAKPMCLAFATHKQGPFGEPNVRYWLTQVHSPDWKRAGTEWMERRWAKKGAK